MPLLPAPMRTALRASAYFGEDIMQRPLPDAAAAAAIYLLSAQARRARGAVLDLRATERHSMPDASRAWS